MISHYQDDGMNFHVQELGEKKRREIEIELNWNVSEGDGEKEKKILLKLILLGEYSDIQKENLFIFLCSTNVRQSFCFEIKLFPFPFLLLC